MPANNTRHTLERHWELFKLLPSHAATGKSIKELTQELNSLNFDIKVRQVERDLKTLEVLNLAICDDRVIPFRWSQSHKSHSMSLSEAVSWQLVAKTIKNLLPVTILHNVAPHFEHAQKKLESLKKNNRAATWTEKIAVVQPTLPLIAPTIAHDILETVQESVIKQQQIEVVYRAAHNTTPKKMTLHPLALVQRGLVTYVVARVNSYADNRLFALHRIEEIVLTQRPANIPPDFNLELYIASGALHFGNGEQICLILKVNDWLKTILEETPLSTDQKITLKNDAIFIEATVLNTPQLEWWLLSQADGLEVLEPIELREKIAERLLGAARQYQ